MIVNLSAEIWRRRTEGLESVGPQELLNGQFEFKFKRMDVFPQSTWGFLVDSGDSADGRLVYDAVIHSLRDHSVDDNDLFDVSYCITVFGTRRVKIEGS